MTPNRLWPISPQSTPMATSNSKSYRAPLNPTATWSRRHDRLSGAEIGARGGLKSPLYAG